MHYVYRLYDADDRVLYVGCSSSPLRRLFSHRSKSWGKQVVSVRWYLHEERSAALADEAAQIAELQPPHNVRLKKRAA